MGILSWAERNPALAVLSVVLLTVTVGVALGLSGDVDPRVAETQAETDAIRAYNGMPPLVR